MAVRQDIYSTGVVWEGTYEDLVAWYNTLTANEREKYKGNYAEVSDKPGQEYWMLGKTMVHPLNDIAPMTATEDTPTVSHTTTQDRKLKSVVKRAANGAIGQDADGVKVEVDGTSIGISNNKLGTIVAADKPVYLTENGVDFRFSSDEFNNATLGTDKGIYVPKLRVAAGSVGLLDIANDEISITKLAQGEVFEFIGTNGELSEYLASEQKASDNAQKMDWIVLKDQSGVIQDTYLVKATNPSTVNDYIRWTGRRFVADQIQSGDGWAFNASTNVGRVVRDTTATRNDFQVSSNGALVDIPAASFEAAGATESLTNHIANSRNRLAALEGFKYENGLTKTGSVVKLGGVISEDTTLTVDANKTLAYYGFYDYSASSTLKISGTVLWKKENGDSCVVSITPLGTFKTAPN